MHERFRGRRFGAGPAAVIGATFLWYAEDPHPKPRRLEARACALHPCLSNFRECVVRPGKAISAAERNRWSKDGRLMLSGASTFRKGERQITLSTYAPEAIEVLMIGLI